MTTTTHRPVVLPASGTALRARIAALLAKAEVPVLESPGAGAELAVVELTNEPDMVARLLGDAAPRLVVLGVGEPGVAIDPNVIDVVTVDSLDRELLSRLGRLRARRATLHDAQLRQRDLKALLDLTSRYAGATDVDELLHDVTKRLADELAIDRATMVAVDTEQALAHILATSDDPALKNRPIDLSQYPELREVLRTGKPVVLEDAPSHPLLAGVKERVAASDVQNIAALPLAAGGKLLGVLLLRRRTGRGAFTLREVEFLTAVAHASAIALRNVRRLESVRGQRELEKSARIAAEERAQELKRFEAYFEHFSDGIAILDAHACLLSLNPAGLKLLDVTPREALGRHINALTNPTDDGLLLDVLFSVSQGKVRSDVDLNARTAVGRKLTLSVSAAPLGGVEGEGVAILAMRDVTTQRRMADELRQTKEFLERLIDGSVDAIIAADMKGTVMLFNKAAEAITGWSSADAVGHLSVRQIYAEATTAGDVMRRLRSNDLGGPGRLTTMRAMVVSRSGERVPVNMTASVIYEGAREVATVGIFTDLRDRLNLERKLSDAETRLLESEKNAVLVALAGTTAHELNQPLTSVMGYAELLKRKLKEGDPSYRPVDIIHKEAERMAEIVRKIGKITRYETQAYVGDQKIIDLNKAASNED